MLAVLFLAARISTVVVYPDRALVTRVATLPCDARAQASFDAIPPSADPASFRARSSLGTVEGLRSEPLTRAAAFAPKVKELDDKLRKLGAQVAKLRDLVRRANTSTQLAAGYTDVAVALVGREMSDAAPNLKAWNGAFDAALAARVKAAHDTVEAQAKLRELEHQLDDLRARRAQLASTGERREYLAEVLVSCPSGQTTEVELSYLVGGASWLPAYEARADEAAGAVELSTYALVRQTTGENWTHARLVLSTAMPRQDATPPTLSELRVYAEERRPERKVLVRREEVHEHAEAGGQTQPDQPSGGRMRAAAQGLSVQLTVPEPADIAGDNTPARLFVSRNRLSARFALRAAPKMAPFAFRVADLTNSAPFPLLPGPVDAFRRGGLIGRYRQERVAEGAPFHLTFGVEDSVRIKRTVVEEVQRDAGLFGGTRRFRFAYRFEVANYLARAEELELADHIPVAELDDVKVVLDGKTTPGYETRPADGIVSWRVKLRAGEKRAVDLAFHVDVPASYDSGAL